MRKWSNECLYVTSYFVVLCTEVLLSALDRTRSSRTLSLALFMEALDVVLGVYLLLGAGLTRGTNLGFIWPGFDVLFFCMRIRIKA